MTLGGCGKRDAVRAPPRPRIARLAAAACALALSGCGHGSGAGTPPQTAASDGSRFERREIDQHPPITLLVRLGDPQPALAFATVHDSGSVASVAVSALILARLQAHGIRNVVSTPSAEGARLSVLSADAKAARAFLEQVTSALGTPLGERDEALGTIAEHLSALRSHSFAGRAEATLAECSGELGLTPGAPLPDVRTAAGRAEVDKYREQAFSSSNSAFAALGPREFVNAAARELSNVPAWPSGDAAPDAWPNADFAESDAADGARRLSVALRVGDADAALAAVRDLSAERSPLSTRLRSFSPGFGLQRVAFQARPRGACLRVDVSVPDAEPGPSTKEMAQAASLVSEEMRVAQGKSGPGPALDENVVEPSDPREAAARAAWRALAGRLEAGPTRRAVAVTVRPIERTAYASFASALSELESKTQRAPIEARLRAEPGQGELWLLLGSPCGTLGENNDEAGQSALALTLAARAARSEVSLEPWLTPDAVGLLAHAPRLLNENAEQHAERVARALASALTERNTSGDALTTAQSELFSSIGGVPRPGYARLLDALAPERVAWLEPRGTWASLVQSSRDAVAARGRDLLRGPLRVAVIANQDEAQAGVAARAVERWFAPWRDDPRRCQASPERAPRSGELTLSVPDTGNAEAAYIGIPFPSRLRFERESEAWLALFNAPSGPLSRALATERLSASARASIVGGARSAALLIEIRASDDDARKATLAVRRALDQALSSQVSNDELAAAQRAAEQRALGAALDPRRRIVDLWRGTAAEGSLSRASLRAFQSTLSGSAQIVVYVTHRD